MLSYSKLILKQNIATPIVMRFCGEAHRYQDIHFELVNYVDNLKI
jgi:hypothetical protein